VLRHTLRILTSLIFSAAAFGQSVIFQQTGGALTPAPVVEPQLWVDQDEAWDGLAYLPPANELDLATQVWVTGPPSGCTFHLPYWTVGTPTTAGLAAAITDIEACRTLKLGVVGFYMDVPSTLFTSANGLTIPQTSSTPATAFIVLRSIQDASLPNGQTVCSHGIQRNLPTSGDPGLNNPSCNGALSYQLGTTITTIPFGAFTLANGIAMNTANYNDVQYMWTIEASGGSNPTPLMFCNASGLSIAPACGSAIGPDHWVIEDAEVRLSAGNTGASNIIQVGTAGAAFTLPSQFPSHIHFRKVWAHGDYVTLNGSNKISAGAQMSCAWCSVVDSQFSQLLRPGAEGHVILAQGPGPYKFNHNWMEGQSSSIFAAGFSTPPLILGYVPFQDVEIRRNRLTFPYAWLGVMTIPGGDVWAGLSIVRKNCMEWKEGERIIRDANICENVDNSGGQNGAITDINIRQTSGTGATGQNYQATITDVTYTNEIDSNACDGIAIAARSASGPGNGGGASYPLRRLLIGNVLEENITNTNPGCGGDHFGLVTGSTGQTWQGIIVGNGTMATFVAQCSVDAGDCIGQVNAATVNGCSGAGTLTFSSPNLAGGIKAAGTYNSSCVATITTPGSGYTSAPTVTSTTGTATATINASSSGIATDVGFQVMAMSAGDPVWVSDCTAVTGFNAPTHLIAGFTLPINAGPLLSAGSAPWTGTFSSAGVTVSWPSAVTGTDGAGYCNVSNTQGAPLNMTLSHHTMITDAVQALYPLNDTSTGPDFQLNFLFLNSIFLNSGIVGSAAGWYSSAVGVNPEGTNTELFGYDVNSMTAGFNVWPTRPASKYTDYGNNPFLPLPGVACPGAGCSPPTTSFFPTSNAVIGFSCSGCNTAVPLVLNDYHGYSLLSSSPYHNAGSDGADLGVNFPALDAAQTKTIYVCKGYCGAAGPYGDN
jgi:hypothetical protein